MRTSLANDDANRLHRTPSDSCDSKRSAFQENVNSKCMQQGDDVSCQQFSSNLAEHKTARRRLAAAGGLQASGDQGPPLIPEGGGPESFLESMLSVSHPMECPPVLPELVVNITKM